jgi:geranylgeranylglycerol-phosphate geranylgeranyltransferase
VSIIEARNFSLVLMLSGLVFSAMTFNISYILVCFSALLLSTLYNVKWKRTGLVGNALVSAMIALPFLAGGLVANNALSEYILVLALSAFFCNMGREVHKGIVDVEGDSSRGIQTFAVRYGDEAARKLAAMLYCVAVVLTLLPWVMAIANQLYVYAVAFPDAMVIVSVAELLTKRDRESLRRDKDVVRLAMALVMLSFLVGSV